MSYFQGNNVLSNSKRLFVSETEWERARGFTHEGKRGLTDFLEKEERIPSRDKIRSYYDKIVPDDWDKLRSIADNLVKTADADEMARLTTPVVPRMFYKSKTGGDVPIRVVVEVGEESRSFKMYIFEFTDGYHLTDEIYFSLGEGNNLKVDEIMPWYKRVCELYGFFREIGTEDEAFMQYTSRQHDYYDTLFEVAQNMLYNEALTNQVQDAVAKYVADCMDLIVYMNHCIDIENDKRRKAEAEALENSDDEKDKNLDKNSRKVVYHENSKKNAREIRVGDICINLGKKSGTKKTSVMHRKCLCWGVRGHKRYYKSGKVVYIKPYKKGRDRIKSDPEGKTYLLKGEKV